MGFALHAFENCAPLMGEISHSVEIGMDQYAVLTPKDTQDVLMTRGVITCVGLAALSREDDPTAGLMHLKCDGHYYRNGEDAVRLHAANAWDEFAAAMNPAAPLRLSWLAGWRLVTNIRAV